MCRGSRVGITPREALEIIERDRYAHEQWVVCMHLASRRWTCMPRSMYDGVEHSWVTVHPDERSARQRLRGIISADRLSTAGCGLPSGA